MQFQPIVTDQYIIILCMQAPGLEDTGETDILGLKEVLVSQGIEH